MIRKALHTLFLGLFLVYAVAPIWYHIDKDGLSHEIEAVSRPGTKNAPHLFIIDNLDGCGQSASDTGAVSSDDKESDSGILLKKKRAVLSSKKSVEPPAVQAEPPALHLHVDGPVSRVQTSPDKLTGLDSFAYYHSGCSPPRS